MKQFNILMTMLALGLLAQSCTPAATSRGGGDEEAECTLNADCQLGERCWRGECVARDGENNPGNNPDNNVSNNPDNNPGNNPAPIACGNGQCERGEDAASCPEDCETGDPCNGVTSRGRCLDDQQVEYCRVPTGGGTPELGVYRCREDERCDDSRGGASCELTAACRTGSTQCADASTLQTCQAGQWEATRCASGCLSSALGGACAPDSETRTLQLSATLEYRPPREDLTDWDAPLVTPASWLLAISFQGEDVLDVARLDDEGQFSILVPSAPGEDDIVALFAAELDDAGEIALMVVEPGFEPSTQWRPLGQEPNPQVWAWAWSTAGLESGVTLPITQEFGSGAAFAYLYLSASRQNLLALYPQQPPEPLVVWLGLGTAWECGACFTRYPTEVLGTSIETQIWLAGGADEGYWSAPVTAHEFGHYAMEVFGHSPGEGGVHYIGQPTHPGQAWSEGWATFFSTWLRGSTYYYDKQSNGMFWLDAAERRYSVDAAWQRPQPADGLLGLIDENEVAALTWELWQRSSGNGPFDALASPRLNQPPFARGYLRRSWSPDDPFSYSEHESAPAFPDLLDAMLCNGLITQADLDAVTLPNTHYPYPSGAPLCF